ncbi:MAG: hypothetical protein J5486_01890 [Bacteroidaceae bacterium]|nr:hypothetical protein [Bacteroidaceae bacterium]
MEARGIRNNNPLNIRRNSVNNWRGLCLEQTDRQFCQFDSLTMGYRAAAVIMRNYDILYSINTVSSIISRWAPASENNTLAYIRRVCALTGFAPGHVLHAGSKSCSRELCQLLLAMATVECGCDLMHDAQHRKCVSAGVEMISYMV